MWPQVRSPEGKLTLYCKGADTIIFERLSPSCSNLTEVTTEHLNVSNQYVCVCVCVYDDVFLVDHVNICKILQD